MHKDASLIEKYMHTKAQKLLGSIASFIGFSTKVTLHVSDFASPLVFFAIQ